MKRRKGPKEKGERNIIIADVCINVCWLDKFGSVGASDLIMCTNQLKISVMYPLASPCDVL